MSNRANLAVYGYNDFGIEIKDACVMLDERRLQCWCIELRVYWQTIWINGWAFVSSWCGELLFQREPDMKPPHFISGIPIITVVGNDLLWDLAEDTGVNPQLVADAIHIALQKTWFILSPVRLVGEKAFTTHATHYWYEGTMHRI